MSRQQCSNKSLKLTGAIGTAPHRTMRIMLAHGVNLHRWLCIRQVWLFPAQQCDQAIGDGNDMFTRWCTLSLSSVRAASLFVLCRRGKVHLLYSSDRSYWVWDGQKWLERHGQCKCIRLLVSKTGGDLEEPKILSAFQAEEHDEHQRLPGAAAHQKYSA